jgi:beta-ribofuranosylaminobenzene 5'-phosphate synthase
VTEVSVTAPALLHFGMLDPAGIGSRRFGGVGVAVEHPRVVVTVRSRSDDHVAAFDRAETFARLARSAFGYHEGVEVDVREAIPPHVGLGSGTKLGLAIARGVAELAGRSVGPAELARATGRGERSSVGAWTFAAPGLVVEAGVGGRDSISPLVARHPMPDRWRCVLAMPVEAEGLSGIAEERFFSLLQAERAAIEPRVSRLVLTALLPGLVTESIDEFGAALTEIQREIGSMFASQQGGVFHPLAAPIVDALQMLGVGAVGQSSWGPTVYGIVDSPERALSVADRLRAMVDPNVDVRVVDFDRRGASVTRDGSR